MDLNANMRSRIYKPLVLVLLTLFDQTAQARTFTEVVSQLCQRLFLTNKYAFKTDLAPDFSEAEAAELQKWAAAYALNIDVGRPYYPYELAAFVTLQMPEALRFKILTDDAAALTPNQAIQRANALGKYHVRAEPLHDLISDARQHYPGESAWNAVQHELEKAKLWDAATKAKLASDANRRAERARAERVMNLRQQPFYEVKVKGDQMTLPDGKTYKIVGRLKDGSLLFNVRIENFLRTEDYPAYERTNEYIADMRAHPSRYAQGIMRTTNPRSLGFLVADGRYYIHDAHARSQAYATLHDGNVLVDIVPASNGKFYTMTHHEIMAFYTVWMGIPEVERVAIGKAAQKGSFKEVQDAYYRYMRLRRL